MNTNTWVIKEFSNAPLADDRLIKRLTMIAEVLFTNPECTIPRAFKSHSAISATYRFFNNPRITPEALLMSHREQTIERMKNYDTVLVVQDTTTLDYRGHVATKGLGNYATSKNALGLLNHTALAVTTDGTPLGILSRYVWTRSIEKYGKHHTNKLYPTAKKESQRWLDTMESSLKGIPKFINAVTVCDREADFYDFFHKAVSEGKHLLVRGVQNRNILEEGKKLLEEIQNKPIIGQIKTTIPRNSANKIPQRETTLAIKFCPVTIKPPSERKGGYLLPSIKIYVVLAEEVNTPKGIEPISWLLLTTVPVENLEQAVEKIKWYKQRWKIERYHLVLKSGCKVESLQFETLDTLYNALALYSIIAWKLLWLKHESVQNPEVSCEVVLQQQEWQALCCVFHQTSRPPDIPPNLNQAIIMIAKLGGFIGRKNDNEPGVIVIWRGLKRLHDITQGWLIAQLPEKYQ